MITEDYVSLETARLLKDKGFRCATNRYYNAQYDEIRTTSDTFMMNWNDAKYMKHLGMEGAVAIPTLQMTMKWLREEKGVQIEITIVGTDTWESPTKWMYGFRCQTKNVIDRKNADFSLYEQACEEAVKYCLERILD